MASPSASASRNLDSFVKSSRPAVDPIATSQQIRDRGSIFVANIYSAATPEEAKKHINHLKHVVHGAKRATHEIAAWRCMVLKKGRSGLEGPDDFTLITGLEDDGEKWAGSRVLRTMQNQAIIDAVVIVSRWYGGELLGPARFSHIETCTTEVCQAFKRSEELKEAILTLETLDGILENLRAEYGGTTTVNTTDASPQPGPMAPSSSKDYSSLDLAKAQRQINARERSIKSVRAMIEKKREESAAKSQVGVAETLQGDCSREGPVP